MNIDDVRALKLRALEEVVAPMAVAAVKAAAIGISARQFRDVAAMGPRRTMALGISRSGSKDYRLAVRLQRQSMLDRPELDRLRKMATGEIDVRFVGRIEKRATPWYQSRQRPLLIGSSVGHYKVTAGTLGAFVRKVGAEDDALYVLSNNHVLANENRARRGDAVLQAAVLDGGVLPQDQVASLDSYVRLLRRGNRVDCAIAVLEESVAAKLNMLKGLNGKLRGVSPDPVDEGLRVRKLGRTTGSTRGRVTAFELDDVVVEFARGNLSFDGQIEIEGAENSAISDGGDSGSLIVDEDNYAVALLFAGSDSGGKNGRGLTYANPIQQVLDKMNLELALK